MALFIKLKNNILFLNIVVTLIEINLADDCVSGLGTSYTGTQSTTAAGLTCQLWDGSGYTDPFFPGGSAAAASNFCRNPTTSGFPPDPSGPWCFTDASYGNVGYCTNLPPCPRRPDYLGIDYRGSQSTTYSGKVCQAWNVSSPHVNPYNPWPNTDETIAAASNYCRNPNNLNLGLWCYTTDPATVWEPCNVQVNSSSFVCINNKVPYTYVSYDTVSQYNYPCVAWASIPLNWYNFSAPIPLRTAGFYSTGNLTKPIFHPALLPDASLAEASNYCRNPDNDPVGAWCYRSEGGGVYRKDYCKTPCTGAIDCITDVVGSYYQGLISSTRNGIPCSNWVGSAYATGFFPDPSVQDASNFCRNPDTNKWGPWCLKSAGVADPSVDFWDYCTVPWCAGYSISPFTIPPITEECIRTQAGTEYVGNRSTVVVGANEYVCQRWDANTPYTIPYYQPYMLNAATMAQASNYCRNPSGATTGPWCYIINGPTATAPCNIPICVETSTGGTTTPTPSMATGTTTGTAGTGTTGTPGTGTTGTAGTGTTASIATGSSIIPTNGNVTNANIVTTPSLVETTSVPFNTTVPPGNLLYALPLAALFGVFLPSVMIGVATVSAIQMGAFGGGLSTGIAGATGVPGVSGVTGGVVQGVSAPPTGIQGPQGLPGGIRGPINAVTGGRTAITTTTQQQVLSSVTSGVQKPPESVVIARGGGGVIETQTTKRVDTVDNTYSSLYGGGQTITGGNIKRTAMTVTKNAKPGSAYELSAAASGMGKLRYKTTRVANIPSNESYYSSSHSNLYGGSSIYGSGGGGSRGGYYSQKDFIVGGDGTSRSLGARVISTTGGSIGGGGVGLMRQASFGGGGGYGRHGGESAYRAYTAGGGGGSYGVYGKGQGMYLAGGGGNYGVYGEGQGMYSAGGSGASNRLFLSGESNAGYDGLEVVNGSYIGGGRGGNMVAQGGRKGLYLSQRTIGLGNRSDPNLANQVYAYVDSNGSMASPSLNQTSGFRRSRSFSSVYDIYVPGVTKDVKYS